MRPKVGIPQALTYHYRSSRIVERFLREAGAEVVRSPKTTPEIHAAATTLGSADFCLSLRMLVGHVHHLVTQHPDLDFLLVPHLCSEDGEKTTTCSKYRDAGGVALRSLTTTLDYLMQHAPQDTRQAAAAILQAAGVPRTSGDRFPVLLQPYICSLQREDMFNVCFGVYCDVFGISSAVRIAEGLVPQRLQGILAPHLRRCVAPFETAYEAVMRRDTRRLDRFLADTQAVRVGLICREYLVDEPLLTADVKAWFMKAGARVITPEDVRAEDLPPGPQAPWAFYDTHRRFDALVEFLAPHVDGFIFAGSFGCHPDAFIMDLLLDRVRRQGIPAWLFRYDEQSGSAGFQTRYETIMRLLEQRRDRRLAGGLQTPSAHPWPAANASDAADAKHASTIVTNPAEELHRVPLLIWPYMSDHIDLIMRELLEQGGLTQYALPPKTASDVTLSLGSDTFTDSCCPYAFSTGSFIETLQSYFEAHRNGPARRIVALTARGEGPCSFGLYLLGHARDVPGAFREVLKSGGHTLEFLSIGLSDVTRFIQELAELGNQRRLAPIVDYLRKAEDGTLDRLPAWRRFLEARRLWGTLAGVLAPARAKLAAVEAVRSKALIVRPHETTPGAVTEVYRRGIRRLGDAHTVEAVRSLCDETLAELAGIPQDRQIRPRVAVVGEIYVIQASFANRGVIDNLLARHGVEVVEGTTLAYLIGMCERDLRRRAWLNMWPLRPILRALWRRNIMLLNGRFSTPESRPFMNLGVGGEGNVSVAHARRLLEAGADGVVHLFPFKCMPEGIAKAAMAELCRLYNVPYLPMSFNRELEIERLKTEIATFAVLLHARVGQLASAGREAYDRARTEEIARRRALGAAVNRLHSRYRRHRFAVA